MRRACSDIGRRAAAAFTLIEMLVVIGIIVLLIGLLVTAVVVAQNNAKKSAISACLGTISAGIEAYHADFGIYPPSTGGGAAALASALMGPGAAGFRMTGTTTGRLYGPYISPDSKIYNGSVFIDPLGNPILYYKAQINPSGAAPTMYFDSAHGIFNPGDNSGSPQSSPGFLQAVGNIGGSTYNAALAGNNKINPGESPINMGTYLLVSPGLYGAYFDSTATNTYYQGASGGIGVNATNNIVNR